MNEKLKKLGFEANRIIETILLIKAREKIKNSPIGVKLDKNQLLTATIYKTNQIYKNIKKHSVASLNITNKAKLFYDSVFNKKLKTNGLRLEKSHYTIKGEIIELKKQKNYLDSLGVSYPSDISKSKASDLIEREMDKQPATDKQRAALQKANSWEEGMSKKEASEKLDQIYG